MTPVEARQKRIVSRIQQFARHNIRVSPADAARYVDEQDPGLAFQASQQINGVMAAFQNENKFNDDHTAENQAAADRAAADTKNKSARAERARIRDFFMPCVHARMQKENISYDQALRLVKSENLEFANAVNCGESAGYVPPWEGAKRVPGSVLTESSDGKTYPQKTIGDLTPEEGAQAAKMGLPYDCTREEYEAAQSAGSMDKQKIWDALCGYMQKKYGCSAYLAQSRCVSRFPQASIGVKKPYSAPVNTTEGSSFDGNKISQ